MNRSKPVLLGGTPLFQPPIPFARPLLPSMESLQHRFQEILTNGMVTTGPYAQQFEDEISNHLQVKHAVAVSSCTTGLLLAVQALQLPPRSTVVLPSFTFMASAIAPVWNGLNLCFADIDRDTFLLSADSVEQTLAAQAAAEVQSSVSAILAVPIFGNPTSIPKLNSLKKKYGLKFVLDSAHGFGALQEGRPLGSNGDVEVFSLSPTKLLIAGEGGMVVTRNDAVAEHVRVGRYYGNPGNYDSLFCGINARMSEFHALCGLESLTRLEDAAAQRNRIAHYYTQRLSVLPGIRFQKVTPNNRCSYKDFSIVIEDDFGLDRDGVQNALEAEGISTRVYFSPTLHQMTAYKRFAGPDIHERLPNTLWLEKRILCLPLYSNMTQTEAGKVCEAIERIHHHAGEIRALAGK